ncbi:MAG: WGR domain-containing protein [Gemmataceae bacterium]
MANIIREAKYIKSDVVANNNKFWYITEFDDASCVVQFGRVGGDGATKTHNFPNQPEATHFFDKKCREKEGDRKGYRKLQVINGANGVSAEFVAKQKLEKVTAEQIAATSAQTQALIRYLTKVNVHNILTATTMKYDMDKGLFSTPCGIVTQDGIAAARALLKEIGDYVAAKKFRNPAYMKILNDYLMLIPQKVGRKLDAATLYPHLDAVRQQNDILDALDASLQSVMSQPLQADEPEQTIERIFDVKLETVDSKKEIERIREKYRSTLQARHACAHLDVKTVYAVEITSMQAAWEKQGKEIGTIWELWHGTRASNLLSILKSGFVIPPSNAPHCTGRMFGNGVYFSDQSTKSLNYAFGYWGGGPVENNCFMFLVDVAMGKYYVPDGPSSSLPKKGYDSTYAQAGKSGVINNEMIVYQTCQINPRLLIEFAPKNS